MKVREQVKSIMEKLASLKDSMTCLQNHQGSLEKRGKLLSNRID